MSAWVYCATCRAPHQTVEVIGARFGGMRLIACSAVADTGPWVLSGDLAPRSVAIADCQRCGAPAHPIRGYCGRFCEEAARYEAERRETWTLRCHKPGYHPRIAGLDPVTPEETTAAYAEAYAAIERDLRETVAASPASFGPAARAALLGDDP